MNRPRTLRAAGVVGLFTALTVFMTWPQALYLATKATPHQDVFFNMWRLRWFAHALVTRNAEIWNANIFFPEPRTFALSDAMFVEGAIGAPLSWIGLGPVLVHNLLLLGAMTACGVTAFMLARFLTASRGAGVVAGIVFAYAPYRFEHIMHMELQWVMWAPLAFLALHRTCDKGRLRDGLALGACLALQMLSSIYYGIFLLTLIALAGTVCLLGDRRAPLRPVVISLAAAALLGGVISASYSIPYTRVHQTVGDRPIGEVSSFSASPANYLIATPNNWLYGSFSTPGRMERRLFPGATPVLLAVVALLLRVPERRQLLYVLLLVCAFEMSLGFRGFSYGLLHDYVPVYRGLRAAARLGVFVLLFLAVLAGYGYRALAAGRSLMWRAGLLTVCTLALMAEYSVHVTLELYQNTTPPVYRLLASQPRGVVAEFPMPRANSLPGWDPQYAYFSTFHWFPLVNGYSGVYPPSYLARLNRMPGFPDETSCRQLRRDRVRYVVVHAAGYERDELYKVREGIERSCNCVQLGGFSDGNGDAWLYRLY